MTNKPIYRMSEIGHCARALSAKRLGYETEPEPEFLAKAAEEGNWHHDRIRQQLMSREMIFVDCKEKEVALEHPNWSFSLVGHIDGTCTANSLQGNDPDNQDWRLLEIKSMSQFEFDRWMKGRFKEFPYYADQLTCYMQATGLEETLYIVKNRSSGYEDRQVIKGQPSSFEDILQKLSGIELHIKTNSLVETEYNETSLECRRCAYKALCLPEPKDLLPVEEQVLINATNDWRNGKRLETAGQLLINNAKKILENQSLATVRRWTLNNLVINLIQIGESTTYPKAKLLETFTEEQLAPVAEAREAYNQLRITDLAKGEEL